MDKDIIALLTRIMGSGMIEPSTCIPMIAQFVKQDTASTEVLVSAGAVRYIASVLARPEHEVADSTLGEALCALSCLAVWDRRDIVDSGGLRNAVRMANAKWAKTNKTNPMACDLGVLFRAASFLAEVRSVTGEEMVAAGGVDFIMSMLSWRAATNDVKEHATAALARMQDGDGHITRRMIVAGAPSVMRRIVDDLSVSPSCRRNAATLLLNMSAADGVVQDMLVESGGMLALTRVFQLENDKEKDEGRVVTTTAGLFRWLEDAIDTLALDLDGADSARHTVDSDRFFYAMEAVGNGATV